MEQSQLTHNFFYFRVFCALIRREICVLKQDLRARLIDGIAPVLSQVLVLGYLFDRMGMSQSLIGPAYAGTVLQLSFFVSYSMAQNLKFDLKHDRFFEYQLTLPLPKSLLLATYATTLLVNITCITLPLFGLGIPLLANKIDLSSANWFAFIGIFLLSALLFSLLMLFFVFRYDFDWFWDNLWARRLSPIFNLSAAVFLWHQTSLFSPTLGWLLLLNPITYAAEGIRAALLQGTFLPLWACFAGLIFFNTLLWIALMRSLTKSLDPV